MSVREASLPTDTEDICELLNFIELTEYPLPSNIETTDDFWFVCEKDGKIIGCVAANKNRCEIRHIVVRPEYQGKGMGTRLALKAIDFLRKKGVPSIWAQIRIENNESRSLFEKLGFKKTKIVTSRKDPKVKLYKYVMLT